MDPSDHPTHNRKFQSLCLSNSRPDTRLEKGRKRKNFVVEIQQSVKMAGTSVNQCTGVTWGTRIVVGSNAFMIHDLLLHAEPPGSAHQLQSKTPQLIFQLQSIINLTAYLVRENRFFFLINFKEIIIFLLISLITLRRQTDLTLKACLKHVISNR